MLPYTSSGSATESAEPLVYDEVNKEISEICSDKYALMAWLTQLEHSKAFPVRLIDDLESLVRVNDNILIKLLYLILQVMYISTNEQAKEKIQDIQTLLSDQEHFSDLQYFCMALINIKECQNGNHRDAEKNRLLTQALEFLHICTLINEKVADAYVYKVEILLYTDAQLPDENISGITSSSQSSRLKKVKDNCEMALAVQPHHPRAAHLLCSAFINNYTLVDKLIIVLNQEDYSGERIKNILLGALKQHPSNSLLWYDTAVMVLNDVITLSEEECHELTGESKKDLFLKACLEKAYVGNGDDKDLQCKIAELLILYDIVLDADKLAINAGKTSYEQAKILYQRVLAVDSKNIMALNGLAFVISEYSSSLDSLESSLDPEHNNPAQQALALYHKALAVKRNDESFLGLAYLTRKHKLNSDEVILQGDPWIFGGLELTNLCNQYLEFVRKSLASHQASLLQKYTSHRSGMVTVDSLDATSTRLIARRLVSESAVNQNRMMQYLQRVGNTDSEHPKPVTPEPKPASQNAKPVTQKRKPRKRKLPQSDFFKGKNGVISRTSASGRVDKKAKKSSPETTGFINVLN